ncbi:hypothetical protein J3459_012758 [Metarhizium acridum]|nr:hypothetical protein J3459_012758 [Metarhizium acridum]
MIAQLFFGRTSTPRLRFAPPAMASKPTMNVQSFPRPPRLEKISRHLLVVYKGQTIAETKEAFWALETHHPPTYYLPPSSVRIPLTTTAKKTFCEWKGFATYYMAQLSDGRTVCNRIWSYDQPASPFEPIRGYLSFMPSRGSVSSMARKLSRNLETFTAGG